MASPTANNIFHLAVDPASPRVTVTLGRSGRTYITTPHAAGLALMRLNRDAASGPSDLTWHDHLATHGVAVGLGGRKEITLMTIPAKTRTVTYHLVSASTGVATDIPLTLTFPPLLIGIHMAAGRFMKGIIACADPARQAQLGVTSTVPLLTHFPYGNVYATTCGICWGEVRSADVRSVANLDDLFFSSGFNRDLFDSRCCGSLGGDNLHGLATRLTGLLLPPMPAEAYTLNLASIVGGLARSS